ncbi:NAD(P)-dependent oxidoreductase [Mucilaginibacter terrae]|uniref:NADH-flavin reductase n=1 Tax=Mucilaginibacter terrae TaxID=1955052 RepID=A0ABU3GUQ8_9SPHI|nr:NAD(P)H-binding protein [Mucilaginibacter terrae]MDT3403508.1 putative NADH-flavin reductase [Mucilaginibacter terrae]
MTHQTVALIGATGKAGKYILQHLLTSGYKVNALIRKPKEFLISHPLLEVIQGDAKDADTIDMLLQNCTAVISTLGQKPGEPLCSALATRHIISGMEKHHIERYVFLSGLNLDVPGDRKSETNQAKSLWMRQHYPEAVANKQDAYELVAKSNIDYTMIRLPLIEQTDERRKLIVDLHDCPGEDISTTDLAEFIVQQINNKEYVRKAPFVASL